MVSVVRRRLLAANSEKAACCLTVKLSVLNAGGAGGLCSGARCVSASRVELDLAAPSGVNPRRTTSLLGFSDVRTIRAPCGRCNLCTAASAASHFLPSAERRSELCE